MYIDFKITTWERIHIEDESLKDKIVAALKSGEIASANDVFKFDEDADSEILYEVASQMTVEENGGCSTIEACEDKTLLYENGESQLVHYRHK